MRRTKWVDWGYWVCDPVEPEEWEWQRWVEVVGEGLEVRFGPEEEEVQEEQNDLEEGVAHETVVRQVGEVGVEREVLRSGKVQAGPVAHEVVQEVQAAQRVPVCV